jgi:predicted enzyme involved in methoxymalonyl-ACP biosynthesis
MSCRALGRGVEDAFLHGIATVAAERGAVYLQAQYVEGPRNAQVKAFLARNGFQEETPNNWMRALLDVPTLPSHVRFGMRENRAVRELVP